MKESECIEAFESLLEQFGSEVLFTTFGIMSQAVEARRLKRLEILESLLNAVETDDTNDALEKIEVLRRLM